MASETFDLTRALMAAVIKDLEPHFTPIELRIRVSQRLYAGDLDADTIARFSARIRAGA